MNSRTHTNHHRTETRTGFRNNGSTGKHAIRRKALIRRHRARVMKAMGIQPAGLKVGAANDKYEQEAEKVAEHVVNSPVPAKGATPKDAGGAQRSSGHSDRNQRIDRGGDTSILTKRTEISRMPDAKDDGDTNAVQDEIKSKSIAQRKCATCEQEAKRTIQRQAKPRDGAFTASRDVSREVGEMRRSGGRPLPASERAFLEPRFGRDLSHVRIHNDEKAARTSRAIDAKAFTVGNNIAFSKGYYKPGTYEGRKLLAHEVTHTIQQTGGRNKNTGSGTSPSGIGSKQVRRRYSPEYKERYHKNLRKALEILLKGTRMQRGNRFGTIMDHSNKLKHWRVERRRVGRSQVYWPYMILNQGSKPSAGLHEIVNNVDKLKYECAQTLTMARLYAHMLTMGAKEYDKKMGHLSQEFRFTFLFGTGLKSTQWYRRTSINGPMEVIKGGRKHKVQEKGNTLREREASILGRIPKGSRVNWRNTDPSIPEQVSYKMENALLMDKQGHPRNYVYASHPYGFVSAEKIIDSLNASARYKGHKNSTKKGIYLYEIEVPDTAAATADEKKRKINIGGQDFDPSL